MYEHNAWVNLMLNIEIMTYRIALLLLAVTYKIYAQPAGCPVVTNVDLLLTEHIDSLFRNRVPHYLRPQLEKEVIRIISHSIRKEDPTLSEEDISDRSKQWLQEQLNEMERQDREDFPDYYDQNDNNDTDEGCVE